MPDPAITLNSVVRRFATVTAVASVSLEVQRGEIFGLLGHNGAGKTTLLRLINGLLRTDEGSITTLGMDPVADGSVVRGRTGVLTEYPALDQFLTPFENLAVYASINGLDDRAATHRADELLTTLGLQAHRDVASHGLSAGLKQRVALARALVHDPELLLLDEPTSNLDPIAARSVRDLVQELSRGRGRTVVLSTHNLVEAQYLCDRVAVIRQGRLLALGTLDEMRAGLAVGAVHVEVDADDDARARDALAELADVTVVGDHGRLEIRVHQDRIPDVVRALVTARAHVHAVVPATPTLEDVYVALHEHRSPATGAQVPS